MSLPGFDLMGLVAHDVVLAKLSGSVKVVTAFPCPICAKTLRQHVVDKLSLFWCPCGYAGSVLDLFLYPSRGKWAESIRKLRALAPPAITDPALERELKLAWDRLDMQARILLGKTRIDHGALAPWVIAALQNLGVYPVRQRDARGKLLFLPLLAETPSTLRELEGDEADSVDMLDFVPVGSSREVTVKARNRFSLFIPSYMAPSLPCGFHKWDLRGNELPFEPWTESELEQASGGVGGYVVEKLASAVVTNVAPAFVSLHQRWSAGRDDACPLLYATDPCDMSWAVAEAIIWFPDDIQAAIRVASRCDGRISTWHPGWKPPTRIKSRSKPRNNRLAYWQDVTYRLGSSTVQQVLSRVRGTSVPWRDAASAYLREAPAAAAEFLRTLPLPPGVLSEITGKAEDNVDGSVFFIGSRSYREKASGLYETTDGKEELVCGAHVRFDRAVHYEDCVYLQGSVRVGAKSVNFHEALSSLLTYFPSWLQTLCARNGMPIPYVRVGARRGVSGTGDLLVARFNPVSVRGYDSPRRDGDVFVLDGCVVEDGEIKEREVLHRRPDFPSLDFSAPGFEHGVAGWYIVAMCASSLLGNVQHLMLCGSEAEALPISPQVLGRAPSCSAWPALFVEAGNSFGPKKGARDALDNGKRGSIQFVSPVSALCRAAPNRFAVDLAGWTGKVSWYKLAQLLAFGQADGFRHGTDFLACLELAREMGVPLPPPLSLSQLACMVDGPGFMLDNLQAKARARRLTIPVEALLADAAKKLKRDGKLWH